ncbi:hypothetical protein SAMN02910355_2242 [Terrisporobacter glycolicus]|nr:hypothetical protein SAMN02910355_2242 [Terrisporobacter glycolicus]
MLTDIDKEFDTPEIDENGELIEVIEEDDVFIEEDTGLEEQPDSFYEDIEEDIVQEGEEEDEFDNIQEVTVEAKENYENAKEQLVAIFTSILEKGEITAEDNVEIEQVKEQYSEAYNSIKENTEVIQKKTLEERVQELADGMVGATSDEILNILTDDGRKPWLYKDEDNNVLIDGTSIPELTMLVNKFKMIATDGEDESSIVLTPTLIQLIAESDIQLSAKKILIEGLLEGTGWRIDEEGRMVLQDLNINGDLTCTNLNVTDSINSSKYPQSLDSSMNIYVHEKDGDDESILKDGATFKTLGGALDSIPKNLNGKTINIQLNSDITETISTDWFGSGRLRIFFGGHTLYGTYTVYRTICMHEVYGGTIDDSMGNTGIIMPYVGKSAAGVSASMLNMGSPDVAMYNMKVYEAKTLASGCTESAGVACGSTGCMYTRGITIVGCDYGFRTNANGIIYDDSSSGKVKKYGFIAVSGGQIRLSNGVHTGGTSGNTYESSGGTVKYHGGTFDGISSSDSNTSTEPTVTTKKVTYTSNSGDTWRTTYDSWRKENIVIEGNGYGSGNCRGYWFFGSQLGQIKGSEVLKVVLKVKRAQIGAWSSKSTIKLAYHNYLSRPSSPDAPTYFASVEIGAYSGDYVSINITNSTVLKGIKDGTIKGFGLYDSSYGTYVGCSSSAKVEITYKE